MAFQLKDFSSIAASTINYARAVTKKATDWLPGSSIRTIIESPAIEIEELYLQMFIGLREAIPVAIYNSFRFDLLPPSYARGFVSVSHQTPISAAITIPQGTVFRTQDGRQYKSSQAVTWPINTVQVRVPVIADAPGLYYNVSTGAINESSFFDATYTISNAKIENGRDEESPDERQARFRDYVAALSTGTVHACYYSSRQAVVLDIDGNISEYVLKIGLEEVPGIVKIYLYSNSGIPSAGLIEYAQTKIDGYRDGMGEPQPGIRAGGVKCQILPMIERLVPMAIQVKPAPGYTLNSAMRQDISDAYDTVVRSILPRETLYIGMITDALLDVTGVLTVVPLATSNVICGVNESLVPGTLTITGLT